jgi:hypothetical protein
LVFGIFGSIVKKNSYDGHKHASYISDGDWVLEEE